MWAMIPMLRVFSRVNLRGMGKVSLCLLAYLPDSGRKKRALQARDITWRTARGVGLCLECLHEVVGPRRSVRTDMQRPAAKPQDSSAAVAFRGMPSPLQQALM